MKHAVFTTEQDLFRYRSSRWLNWNDAQDEWERLDDRRRAGELPHVRFFEVRSADDPTYNVLPYYEWLHLPNDERPQWVKLDRTERRALLELGRRDQCLDDASDAMFTRLSEDLRWVHLPAVDVIDYAHAAARFCCPAREQVALIVNLARVRLGYAIARSGSRFDPASGLWR